MPSECPRCGNKQEIEVDDECLRCGSVIGADEIGIAQKPEEVTPTRTNKRAQYSKPIRLD